MFVLSPSQLSVLLFDYFILTLNLYSNNFVIALHQFGASEHILLDYLGFEKKYHSRTKLTL